MPALPSFARLSAILITALTALLTTVLTAILGNPSRRLPPALPALTLMLKPSRRAGAALAYLVRWMGMVGLLLLAPVALAVPAPTNTDPSDLSNRPATPDLSNPQTAPAPASPFINPTAIAPTNSAPANSAPANAAALGQATQAAAGNLAANPLAQTNLVTPTLAQTMAPSTEALSAANQQLLSHNAQLQRDINDLSTQVNVLVNERSGQLFMYGAITVVVSSILGFVVGAFVFGRRDSW